MVNEKLLSFEDVKDLKGILNQCTEFKGELHINKFLENTFREFEIKDNTLKLYYSLLQW